MPMPEYEINIFGASSDASFLVIQLGTENGQQGGQNRYHVPANPPGDNGMVGETSSRGDRRQFTGGRPLILIYAKLFAKCFLVEFSIFCDIPFNIVSNNYSTPPLPIFRFKILKHLETEFH